MSAYSQYKGKECLGAVLHALENLGVPLRIVEVVTISMNEVFYGGRKLAEFKWFALNPDDPKELTPLILFNKHFEGLNTDLFRFAGLVDDGSMQLRLVMDQDYVPAVFIPDVSDAMLSCLDKFLYPDGDHLKMMTEAGMCFGLTTKGVHIKMKRPTGIKSFMDYAVDKLRWQ